MINQRFGNLVAIRCIGRNQYGKIWKCNCDCGNTHCVVAARLKNGTIKSCGCSKQYENLIGKKFGKLIVLRLNKKDGKNITWICRCEDGNTVIVNHYHLKSGHTQSCGCFNKKRIRETKLVSLSGVKYFNLTPISINEKVSKKKIYWKCQCSCGNKCSISATSIVSGNTKSCGCIRKNQKKENHPRWKHSLSQAERESGKRKWNTDEHKKWRTQIFQRDKYTCQLSGQIGGQLVAHHIKSWNAYKNLRFAVENGITITRKLHILFHKLNGYGNNNEIQFEKFKNQYVKTPS